MPSVSLYRLQLDELQVSVEARFDGDRLIIDGCDQGERVRQLQGDWDYEYSLTLPKESVDALGELLGAREPEALLAALAARFHGPACFSQIRSFLETHGVKARSFFYV